MQTQSKQELRDEIQELREKLADRDSRIDEANIIRKKYFDEVLSWYSESSEQSLRCNVCGNQIKFIHTKLAGNKGKETLEFIRDSFLSGDIKQ